MKTLLLILALAAAPAAAGIISNPAAAAAAVTALGDLSSYRALAVDTMALAEAGDLAGAEKRITDFETAWDDAESTLRPKDTATWTTIDHAADGAIEALRAGSPDKATVVPALNVLIATLDDPASPAIQGGVAPPPTTTAAAFSITNPDGSPVPCEVTLEELRRVSATTAPAAADKAKFEELQAKGIERCNADDDKRADKFFSDALGLLGQRS